MKDGARWAGNKMPKGVDRAMSRLSTYSPKGARWGLDDQGNKLGGFGNWARRQAGGIVAGGAQGVGSTGQGITSRLGKSQNINATAEEKAKAAKRTFEQNTAAINKTDDPAKLLADIMTLIDKKQIKDAIKTGAISPEKFRKVYEMTVMGGPDTRKEREALERSFGADSKYAPMVARTLNEQNPERIMHDANGNIMTDSRGNTRYEGYGSDGLTEEDKRDKNKGGKGYKSLQEKMVAEAKSAEDIGAINMPKKEMAAIIAKHWNGDKIGKAIEIFGTELTDELQSFMKGARERALAKGGEEMIFDEVGQKALMYMANTPGAVAHGLNPVSNGLNSSEKVNAAYQAYTNPQPTPISITSVEGALNQTPDLTFRLKSEALAAASKKADDELRIEEGRTTKANRNLADINNARNAASYAVDTATRNRDDLINAPAPTTDRLIEERAEELRKANEAIESATLELEIANEDLEGTRDNRGRIIKKGARAEAQEAEETYKSRLAIAEEAKGQERVFKSGLKASARPEEGTKEDPSAYYRRVGASPREIAEIAAGPDHGFNLSELTTTIESLGSEFSDALRSYVQDAYNQNQQQNRELWEILGRVNKEALLKMCTVEGRRMNNLNAIMDEHTNREINLTEKQIDALEKTYREATGTP
jgi:hypothetical protein